MTLLIIFIGWLLGFAVSFLMQRTEIAADKEPYTFGNRLAIIATSFLSWLWVIVILITAWINSVKPIWTEPVIKEVSPIVIETKEEKKDRSVKAEYN